MPSPPSLTFLPKIHVCLSDRLLGLFNSKANLPGHSSGTSNPGHLTLKCSSSQGSLLTPSGQGRGHSSGNTHLPPGDRGPVLPLPQPYVGSSLSVRTPVPAPGSSCSGRSHRRGSPVPSTQRTPTPSSSLVRCGLNDEDAEAREGTRLPKPHSEGMPGLELLRVPSWPAPTKGAFGKGDEGRGWGGPGWWALPSWAPAVGPGVALPEASILWTVPIPKPPLPIPS